MFTEILVNFFSIQNIKKMENSQIKMKLKKQLKKGKIRTVTIEI